MIKMQRYITVAASCVLIIVVSLVAFVVVNAPADRWAYLSIHFALRLEEFGVVMSTLLFVWQRREKSSSKASSELAGSAPFESTIH
jgi:hypothetical protein